jgi:hypothetical protein
MVGCNGGGNYGPGDGGVSIDGGSPVAVGTFGANSPAGGESGSLCPGGLCGYQTTNGYSQFVSYANGTSGYLQQYQIVESFFGRTYTSYGNILLSEPLGPDGNPLPPPVPLPPGKNGQPNQWVTSPGSGNRQKWRPKHPIPSPKGSQPGASWDPDGHWDVDWGNKVRERYLPNGTKVHHFNNPIPFAGVAGGAALGLTGAITIEGVLEGIAVGILSVF